MRIVFTIPPIGAKSREKNEKSGKKHRYPRERGEIPIRKRSQHHQKGGREWEAEKEGPGCPLMQKDTHRALEKPDRLADGNEPLADFM